MGEDEWGRGEKEGEEVKKRDEGGGEERGRGKKRGREGGEKGKKGDGYKVRGKERGIKREKIRKERRRGRVHTVQRENE